MFYASKDNGSEKLSDISKQFKKAQNYKQIQNISKLVGKLPEE